MRIYVLVFGFLLLGASLFAHPNTVTYTTLTVDKEAVNGEIFISGYQVARLAQQFNLDPSQLSQEALKNLLRAYFDDRFRIAGRRGELNKQVVDFRNSDPAEFLSSGLSMIFYVKTQADDFPLEFESNTFFEFSPIQTNKLSFRGKDGRPLPGSRDVLLTSKSPSFAFDPDRPDFSAYDFAVFDSDGDGIAGAYEALYGLDPYNADTDGDGFTDFEEFFIGWDPFSPTPADGQSHESYREAIAEFARQYRRKPTETSLLLSYVEETQLKEERFEPGAKTRSAAVMKTMKVQELDPDASAENGFLALILGRMEEELYQTFDLGSFLLLLGLAVGLGFFHAGASGPGKGLLAAYSVKDGREIKPSLVFALALAASQLCSVILEALLFRLFFPRLIRSLGLVTYVVQMAAGAALAGVAVVLIFAAVRRIRAGMVIGEKGFFDRAGGAVALGALGGLGAAPYFWSLLQFSGEIERTYFVPFFALAYGAGALVCYGLTALAAIAVRRNVLDILPRLTLYAELVSASLMLLFALFFFFIRIPI
ncbi:MAG: hypothetical protein JXD23_15115 [Spirochaetales bacterium]|nr:hypothetical protein [Spirochaetales bacterium]